MTSNTQATAQMTWSERYQAGSRWNSKGFRWMIPTVTLAPVVIFAVDPIAALIDSGSDWLPAIATIVLLTVQTGCFARMAFCYRRANRIWKARS